MTIEQFKKLWNVHITTGHTGKMIGMVSLSTSCLRNRYCMDRAADPETICSECYAAAMLENDFYKNTAAVLDTNYDVLTSTVIPVDAWPVVNASVFRLEAFGDLANETQFINYCNFARRNPGTTFSIWTKNAGIIARALKDGTKKPRNMIIVFSSPFKNHPVNEKKYKAFYTFIDKFFTVYTPEYVAENNVKINCGGRKCLECGRCYNKHHKRIAEKALTSTKGPRPVNRARAGMEEKNETVRYKVLHGNVR